MMANIQHVPLNLFHFQFKLSPANESGDYANGLAIAFGLFFEKKVKMNGLK
jgi:hypothetical protein